MFSVSTPSISPARLLMLRRISSAALALIVATTVQAQAADSAARPATPPTRKTVVSINPFAVFALYFAGDVEHVVAPTTTVGIGLSHTAINDYNNYTSLEAKVRYYPQEKALQGFSIAGTAGFATAKDNYYYDPAFYGPNYPGGKRETRPTIGTELSYQWLLGPKKRFVSVVGVGVKRYLGTEGSLDLINVPILPTARINIGIAF